MTTATPEVIYLIDTGDGVVWCDDRDPTGDGDCDDAVEYVRGDAYEALQAECEKLRKDAAAALSGLPDSLPMEPYQTVDRGSPHYKAGWNACRRAMLAALEKLIAAHHEAHRKPGGES